MAFLAVDGAKCCRDGACVNVCPLGLLHSGAGGLPEAAEEAQESCIGCGHCVSVCPKAAISVEKAPLGLCAGLPEGWNLCAGQVEPLLKGRRSIRVYKKEPVSRELLEKAIDIARYGPTGINTQSIRWAVIYEREKVARLAGLTIAWMRGLIAQGSPLAQPLRLQNLVDAYEKGRDPICRFAPHLVYTYALKEDMMAPTSAPIALTFFDIAAVSMGLGACWAGYVHMALNASAECRGLAGMNSRCNCFGAMLAGYPAYAYRRIPPRNKPHISFK